MAREVRSVLPLQLMLGEGPVWDGARQVLWFVDVKGRRIFRYDPAAEHAESWEAPEQVGWVLPARGMLARGTSPGGMMLVGLKNGLHSFDPASGAFAFRLDPEPHLPDNRLNDAATDGAGRIWFGTMDDGEGDATGRIHVYDGKSCRETGLPPVEITNGPAFSPDGRWLYHTDTLARRIWRSRIEDGRPVETALFAEIKLGRGYPDGPTVDAEGCLWTGLFGGWGVHRYDPDGRLMERVELPVANVTKIAFGGADLGTAYATTARKGLDAAALAQQPLAGNLFAFDPQVAGLPLTPAIF